MVYALVFIDNTYVILQLRLDVVFVVFHAL